jgi:hypothetical protein
MASSRVGRAAFVAFALLAAVVILCLSVSGSGVTLEGLVNRKAGKQERAPREGQAEAHGGSIPSQKEEKTMFPGVPFGNAAAAGAIMGPGQEVPQAPSALTSQLLGYIQPLGDAPDLSGGEGAPVNATGLGGSGGGIDGKDGRSTHGSKTQSVQTALPKGIPKSKIPKGQEDMYILKTEIVPPVCPACPACPECPRPVCPKPNAADCPACPAPGRCPPASFGCQRVPLYQNMQSGVLPAMLA